MFTGTYTAIVTPFKNGELDVPALERIVKMQIRGGVDGVVPVGTTGESSIYANLNFNFPYCSNNRKKRWSKPCWLMVWLMLVAAANGPLVFRSDQVVRLVEACRRQVFDDGAVKDNNR